VSRRGVKREGAHSHLQIVAFAGLPSNARFFFRNFYFIRIINQKQISAGFSDVWLHKENLRLSIFFLIFLYHRRRPSSRTELSLAYGSLSYL
jgi:hypothetical protein